MRGSWGEDESNTVYTLNTLQTHFHLKHLTLTAACQLRPLFNNSAEGFQQVKLSNSEIKFKWNPPQTCQCCGKSWHALRHWNILKVESALLSLNCVVFWYSRYCHTNPNFFPLSDHYILRSLLSTLAFMLPLRYCHYFSQLPENCDSQTNKVFYFTAENL